MNRDTYRNSRRGVTAMCDIPVPVCSSVVAACSGDACGGDADVLDYFLRVFDKIASFFFRASFSMY